MNIHDALKSIENNKAEYFKYKFPDLRFDQSRPLKSEEDFLRLVERKTINPFLKWEKTSEYKNLVILYLETKVADDLLNIYNVTSEKAQQGEEKSVRLFLAISKEITNSAQIASKSFDVDDSDDDDDLLLD